MKSIEFTRINNDVNGNPRYVCHYLNLISDEEFKRLSVQYSSTSITEAYAFAIKRANKIGGRKYHTKNYGGGIVFQSYNTEQTEKDILALLAK